MTKQREAGVDGEDLLGQPQGVARKTITDTPLGFWLIVREAVSSGVFFCLAWRARRPVTKLLFTMSNYFSPDIDNVGG